MGNGHAKIIAAAVLWSAGSIMVRITNLPVPEYMWSVTLLALAVMLVKIGLQGRLGEIMQQNKNNVLFFFAIALLMLLNVGFFLFSIRATTLANALLSHYLAPVLVPIFALLILRERVERISVIAVAVAFSGMLLMLLPNELSFSNLHFMGIILGAASAVFYGLEMVARRAASLRVRADVIVCWQFIFSVIILSFIANPLVVLAMDMTTFIYVMIAAVLTSIAPYLLFTSGLSEVKTQHAGILAYMEVAGGMVWGLLLFSEVPPAVTLLGGLMIVMAGYVVIRYGGRDAKRKIQ
jgi:drug/metabolite transporter (DMT)-like permease